MGGAASMIMGGGSLVGTTMGVFGSLRQAKEQNKALRKQAEALDYNARQTEAAGQHAAIEQRRQSELMQSRALALAGASGGGTLDPTVLNILGGIAGEGERAVQSEKYNARSSADAMRKQAMGLRYEGAQIKQAGTIKAIGTAISGIADAGSMFFGAPRGTSQPTTVKSSSSSSSSSTGGTRTPASMDFDRSINRNPWGK